jgi:hypothetical protein
VTDAGGATATDQITVVVTGTGTGIAQDIRIATSSDDAEQRADGSMSLGSSDLEFVFDQGGNQTVGMRFNGLSIPQGATILEASIQFQVDEVNSGATSVTLQGEQADNASTFVNANGNISARPKTLAAVPWSPAPWTSVGAAGPAQKTPDLSAIIQEIVKRAGWSGGNSLAIIVTGSGERTAESFNGQSAAAPLLHVRWTTNQPPQPQLPGQATNPGPADGATGVSVSASLSWTAGAASESHDVYFGTNATPIAGDFRGNQAGTSFDPGALAIETTYYWRIDEVNGDGTTTGTVWSFTTETAPALPSQATAPNPANGATGMSVSASLSWTAGAASESHDVYFGTNATPIAGDFRDNQAGTSFDPGALAFETTYYWRIDEVNGIGTTTGTVWSFTPGAVAPVDAVTITKAEWKVSRQELKVEATSSEQPNAVLTLVGFGEMAFKRGKYSFKIKPVPNNPGSVTVNSDLGGSATKTVKLR